VASYRFLVQLPTLRQCFDSVWAGNQIQKVTCNGAQCSIMDFASGTYQGDSWAGKCLLQHSTASLLIELVQNVTPCFTWMSLWWLAQLSVISPRSSSCFCQQFTVRP